MKILESKYVKAAEEFAVKSGMNWLRLMENAGSAVANIIRKKFDLSGKKITVVCGKGNNGGDGYVVARKLLENNAKVQIISVGPDPSTPNAAEMRSRCEMIGIKTFCFESTPELAQSIIIESDIIVDAIFGIGFSGQVDQPYLSVIEQINLSPAAVISIDIPSGCVCDGTQTSNICINADITVALSCLKICHCFAPQDEFCGETITVSIGMPDDAVAMQPFVAQIIDTDSLKKLFPKRPEVSHKGTFGTAAVVAGSYSMAGAAAFAAKAAMRSGVGLVKSILINEIYPIVSTLVPDAVFIPISKTDNGTLSYAEITKIKSAISNCSALLIGCGMGQGPDVSKITEDLLCSADVPIVLDADGINAICERIDIIKQTNRGAVLTPHAGEAARILGCSTQYVANNRLSCAKQIAKMSGGVIVLKGANTLIALPDGNVFMSLCKNSGLSKAGSGDVLSGIIVSLLAQGMTPESAAIYGVTIHSLAGEKAAKSISKTYMNATDIINSLSPVFCDFESQE